MYVLQCNSDGKPTKFRIIKPSDMHQHVRDGELMKLVVPMVAKRFQNAIIMPNTVPPITTFKAIDRYRAEILKAAEPHAKRFRPLMTFYLTDQLEYETVETGLKTGLAFGVKYYPRGLTTNSDSGVSDPASLWTKNTCAFEVLRILAEHQKVLLLHAADGFDSSGTELDPYDQEPHFVKETLPRIIDAHPDLKISVEHMSTAEGVNFMRLHGGAKLGCSLTAHHLLLDRRDVFRGGFHPHKHWWPIIQPKEHKEELRRFAREGREFVWLGSDSAPHPVGKKEAGCCVGGVLMTHAGIELYAEAFDEMGALDQRFEQFASINGPAFFGAPFEEEWIELERSDWKVGEAFYATGLSGASGGPDKVVPFRLGETIHWQLAS